MSYSSVKSLICYFNLNIESIVTDLLEHLLHSFDVAETIFLSNVRARALSTTITAPETSRAPG